YRDSVELYKRWHGLERLKVAFTPRFALTSSEEQLKSVGHLLREFPDAHMHTHLSENRTEIEMVKARFRWSKNYLDVYDRFGLLGKQSLFAHSIYLSESEWQRLRDTGSSVAFCPTSNQFLGSGDFNLAESKWHRVNVGIGSDIGAGTSFSILRN